MTSSQPDPTGPAKLVTAARVRPESRHRFLEWQARFDRALQDGKGFFSLEILPPFPPDQEEWIFIARFDSPDHLRAWKTSDTRARLFEEAKPFLDGGFMELAGGAAMQYHVESSVTEVIVEQIKPGYEDAYREWSARIQKAQTTFPGYRGGYTQPPTAGGIGWMTLLRFATTEDLNRWLNSPERAALLGEAKEFVAKSYLHRVDTSFPGWAPTDPNTGNAPPNWKMTMLVLLGLYPIVALELRYLMSHLAGLPDAVANFIGNSISAILVAYVTMPLLVRWLDWWLLPKNDAPRNVHLMGTAIVVVVYILEVALCWKFL